MTIRTYYLYRHLCISLLLNIPNFYIIVWHFSENIKNLFNGFWFWFLEEIGISSCINHRMSLLAFKLQHLQDRFWFTFQCTYGPSILTIFGKNDPRSKWTIYKHESDKNKNVCLSVSSSVYNLFTAYTSLCRL